MFYNYQTRVSGLVVLRVKEIPADSSVGIFVLAGKAKVLRCKAANILIS